MKIPNSISKILTNKFVLYFVSFLAVTNLFGYILARKTDSIIIFILVSFLVFQFSKNMIIILGVSILVTNMLVVGNTVKEGLENKDKKKEKDTDINTDITDVKDDVKNDEPTNDTNQTLINTSSTSDVANDEGMNVMSNKKRNRIDYATTVEDAYDDLNKILGGDGIKRLTDDTQKLMGQQLQLAEAMKNMTPILDSAKSMLKGFDLSNLDGLANMAKSFTASTK